MLARIVQKSSPFARKFATASSAPRMSAAAAHPLYDIPVRDIMGKEKPIGETIRGKVTLIVNVASKCGFTGQYKGLQDLQDKFGPRGFTVVGFPCNQFGSQEPGTEEEISSFACEKFKATFPLFAKVDVNGAKEAPLYTYLKEQKGGWVGRDIGWNFAKFLVDKEGKVVDRYLPTTGPSSIEADIEKLLK